MGKAFVCDSCGELFKFEERFDDLNVKYEGKDYKIVINPFYNLFSGVYTMPDLCGYCFSQILMAGFEKITTQKADG